MKQYNLLDEFMLRAVKDCRVTKGHLALYLSLFHLWKQGGFVTPLAVYCQQVMPIAKISSTATYHRLLRDLDAFGYINYTPSFYKRKASTILF